MAEQDIAIVGSLRGSQYNHGAVVMLGFGAGEIVQSRQQALQKFGRIEAAVSKDVVDS